MKRQIWGVLAAVFTAPYLTVFFMNFFDLVLGDSVGIKEPIDILKAIPLGTVALLYLGLPLLFLSCILAFALYGLECLSRWHAVMSGTVLGLLFIAALFLEFSQQSGAYLVAGGLSGAFCGWIYWRIAIRQTPKKAHAIDPA